jgi:hypothetical protein
MAVLSIWSCKALDGPGHLPGEYPAARGVFWSQDYSVQCYAGGHLALLLLVGIPGLALLALLPVLLALQQLKATRALQAGGACSDSSAQGSATYQQVPGAASDSCTGHLMEGSQAGVLHRGQGHAPAHTCVAAEALLLAPEQGLGSSETKSQPQPTPAWSWGGLQPERQPDACWRQYAAAAVASPCADLILLLLLCIAVTAAQPISSLAVCYAVWCALLLHLLLQAAVTELLAIWPGPGCGLQDPGSRPARLQLSSGLARTAVVFAVQAVAFLSSGMLEDSQGHDTAPVVLLALTVLSSVLGLAWLLWIRMRAVAAALAAAP